MRSICAALLLTLAAACGEDSGPVAFDPMALSRALDWRARNLRYERPARFGFFYHDEHRLHELLHVPRDELPMNAVVAEYYGRGAGLALASAITDTELTDVWWRRHEARRGDAAEQVHFIEDVRQRDDERVFEMLLGDLDAERDVWLIPLLVDVLDDPSMAYLAPLSAHMLWEHFPEVAAELTEAEVNALPHWVGRELAESALLAGLDSLEVATFMSAECEQAGGYNWGMIARWGTSDDGTEHLDVLHVCDETPAALADVRAGDRIIGLNDRPYDEDTYFSTTYFSLAVRLNLARGPTALAVDCPGFANKAESDAAMVETLKAVMQEANDTP